MPKTLQSVHTLENSVLKCIISIISMVQKCTLFFTRTYNQKSHCQACLWIQVLFYPRWQPLESKTLISVKNDNCLCASSLTTSQNGLLMVAHSPNNLCAKKVLLHLWSDNSTQLSWVLKPWAISLRWPVMGWVVEQPCREADKTGESFSILLFSSSQA